jgi:hypothetical protein
MLDIKYGEHIRTLVSTGPGHSWKRVILSAMQLYRMSPLFFQDLNSILSSQSSSLLLYDDESL